MNRPAPTLDEYRLILGDRYTDAQLEAIRRALRGLAHAVVQTFVRERPEAR